MQVSVESGEGLERRMTVDLSAERFEAEVEKRLRQVARNARIAGFRPGKVPLKILRQRFGGQVSGEAFEELVRSSFAEAVAQQNLLLAGAPQIMPSIDDAGKHCGYTATFEPLADVAGAIHALYVETMDRVQAGDSYRLPLSYFDGLGDRPDTFACVVRHRGDIAAGCVFFEREGIVQAHLGGTFDAHLLASPFALSLHAAAVRSQGRGGRWLHLGGGVGGARDNLLRFKASLGRGRFRLSSLRLVADPAAYARLLALRGFAPGAEPAGFFPAYRAPRPEPQPLKQAQLAA